MGINSKWIKDQTISKLGEYDEAMNDLLHERIKDYLDGLEAESVDVDEISDIVESWKSELPDPYDWASDEVESMIGDIADQQYELKRDKDMGLL